MPLHQLQYMLEAQRGRFCPECEIRELQTRITKEKIEHDIANMVHVDGVTTPDHVYEKRIETCRSCSSLQAEILCSECGSYVAYRAKILSATCPYPGKNKLL